MKTLLVSALVGLVFSELPASAASSGNVLLEPPVINPAAAAGPSPNQPDLMLLSKRAGLLGDGVYNVRAQRDRRILKRGAARYFILLQHDGPGSSASYNVIGTMGDRSFRVQYFDLKTNDNITARMVSGGKQYNLTVYSLQTILQEVKPKRRVRYKNAKLTSRIDVADFTRLGKDACQTETIKRKMRRPKRN